MVGESVLREPGDVLLRELYHRFYNSMARPMPMRSSMQRW